VLTAEWVVLVGGVAAVVDRITDHWTVNAHAVIALKLQLTARRVRYTIITYNNYIIQFLWPLEQFQAIERCMRKALEQNRKPRIAENVNLTSGIASACYMDKYQYSYSLLCLFEQTHNILGERRKTTNKK